MFFGLLATALIAGGFAVRALAGVVERRPAWVAVLLCVCVALVLVHGRRRRRLSAARLARRAGEALEVATNTALDALDTPPPAPPAAVIPAQRYARDTPGAAEVPVVPDYAALSPEEFEEAIAALCERDGCADVRVVGGAGDLGADVVALSPEGRRIVIQCKRYGDDNKVGSQDLQRFGGTCFTVHEADVALVVTTSGFTAPAEEYAEQCGILCVDRDGLLAWSAGTAPLPWTAGAGGVDA
jgi:restriction system protein